MLLLSHFTKSCSKCKEIKTFTEFSKSQKRIFGLRPQCKKCSSLSNNQYYKTVDKEAQLEKQREYKRLNKDRLKQRDGEYYLKNKDKIINIQRDYILNNKDIVIATKRKWRENNQDSIKALHQKYYNDNIDKFRDRDKKYRNTEIGKISCINKSHRRRTKEKQGDVVTNQLLELRDNAKACYWCNKSLKKVKIHIDHYIPLSKGGLHTISNLVVSCDKCNRMKSAKSPFEFANSIGKLL